MQEKETEFSGIVGISEDYADDYMPSYNWIMID